MFRLLHLGGNIILLHSVCDYNTSSLVEDFDEWINYWFEWVRPWEEIDVNTNRVVWTNWYGVPLHAWSVHFFSFASAQIGRSLKMDKNTEEKNNLEVARVLVSASMVSQIDKLLEFRIEGKSFKIRIMEEARCCGDSIEEDVEDESEDESQDGQLDEEASIDQADTKISDGPIGDEEETVVQADKLEGEEPTGPISMLHGNSPGTRELVLMHENP